MGCDATVRNPSSVAWASDQLHLDRQDGFRNNGELAVEQQVVDPYHRTGQRIFHRRQQRVRGAFIDRVESRIKRRPRHGDDVFTEQLDCGGFAERTGFALKRDAQVLGGGWHD